MARWGMLGGVLSWRVTAAVVGLVLAVGGVNVSAAAADDPPVPPSPPTVTATYHGAELGNCLDQPVCPEIVELGESVTFTLTATSADVVRFDYNLNTTYGSVDGSSATITLTPTSESLQTLQVRGVSSIGQPGGLTYFRFNVGPRPAPIGSWAFDDGSGTTAADGPGLTHPLTLTGGAAFDGKGRVNGSTALDGVDDFAQASDSVVDTSKSFSISAWARPTSSTKNGVVAAVTGTNSSAFGLYYDAASKRWVFGRTSADVSNPILYRASSKEAPINTAWTHLIGTYDANTGNLELYVNGRLQQTTTSPTTPAWQAAGPLTVGRGKYAGAFTGYFAGSLDEVNIWQRVLVAEEIPELVDSRLRSGVVSSGVAAYWPLDNATRVGTTWRTPEAVRGADLTVAGFTGSQAGAFVDDPQYGRVLEMTGHTRESLTLDHSVIDGSTSFTVAARIKIGDPSKPMVVARQGTSGKDTWRIEYNPVDATTSQWLFVRADAASTTETTAVATVDRDSVTDWHLISATYAVGSDGSVNPELAIKVDLRGFSDQSFPSTPTRGGTTTIGTSRTNTKPFNGRLDDLRLYAGAAAQPTLCTAYLDPNNCS